MYVSSNEFKGILMDIFGRMGQDLSKLDSALRRLEALEEHVIEKGKFKEFIEVVTVMADTSKKTSQHREMLEKVCMDAIVATKHSTLDQAEVYIKEIQQILKKIKWLESQSLSYATRLPLSIGSGWKPGLDPFSTLRHLVNIPGYLMMAPFTKLGLVAYTASINQIHDAVRTYKESEMWKEKYVVQTAEAKKRIKEAMKDFRVFIKISRQFDRNFRRVQRDCLNIAKDVPIMLEAAEYAKEVAEKLEPWK